MTDRALAVGAWIKVDKNICAAREVRTEYGFKFLYFAMPILQREIFRQDQVKIDVDSITGFPRPEPMHIDPQIFAMLIQESADLLQERGIGFVHQPRE